LAAIECNVIGSHGGNGPKKTVHTTKGRAARTAAAADMTVHTTQGNVFTHHHHFSRGRKSAGRFFEKSQRVHSQGATFTCKNGMSVNLCETRFENGNPWLCTAGPLSY
jgi:hypothetical protein